ncbi:MAG: hypothetical protein ACK5LE_09520, partial [Alphaproteobacteria bacterium]
MSTLYAYANPPAKAENDLQALMRNNVHQFINLCFASDSMIYQQHKRYLLQSPYPLIFDIPQIVTNTPLTTTYIELPTLKNLQASIQLTNQQNLAKCSLVINGLSAISEHLIEDILEEDYGQYLQNIGQDSQKIYWQYIVPNRDISVLSLYPNADVEKATNIELARYFDILPIRADAPLTAEDLEAYMKDEAHLAAFSLRIFSTSPFWNNWTKQIQRLPVIQKTEGTLEAGETILYLVSRKPKLEFRLIDGINANVAIMLVDYPQVDLNQLITAYTKRLPLFFEHVEQR